MEGEVNGRDLENEEQEVASGVVIIVVVVGQKEDKSEQEDEINTLIPEVLKEFEQKLDIQVAKEAIL